MAHAVGWWHRPWVLATESAVGHLAAILLGFAMMVAGLGLSVTMIMLPVGLVVGLLGLAVFIGGFFARIDHRT